MPIGKWTSAVTMWLVSAVMPGETYHPMTNHSFIHVSIWNMREWVTKMVCLYFPIRGVIKNSATPPLVFAGNLQHEHFVPQWAACVDTNYNMYVQKKLLILVLVSINMNKNVSRFFFFKFDINPKSWRHWTLISPPPL